MSEARRVREAARLAWQAVLVSLEAEGAKVEPWPATDPPRQHSYMKRLETPGFDRAMKQNLVVQTLAHLYRKISQARRDAGADAIVFVKEAPHVELGALHLTIKAALGYARRTA